MASAAAPVARSRIPPPERPAPVDATHVVDITLFFTPTSGGVRRYLLAKHDWCRRSGRLDHTLVVPGPHTGGLRGEVVSVRGPRLPFGGGYRVPVRMAEVAATLARLEPDLVEAGDPFQLAWQSRRVARSRHIPAVAFCHSNLVALASSRFGSAGGRAASAYLRNVYSGFDLVLAPSQHVAGVLDEAGVQDVMVQPLGVDLDVMNPALRRPDLRRTLGIAEGAKLLVFAGRTSAEKRVCDLLEAAAWLGPRFHLLLVGDTRAAWRRDNVTTLAYRRDPADLATILASCDAFVHAGDQETFGLVALEAMACGLPVIAARAGSFVELVDDTVGGTFRPHDPMDLVRAVGDLFERDQGAVGAAARRRAQRYAWDHVFSQLASRYARLLGHSPALARIEA